MDSSPENVALLASFGMASGLGLLLAIMWIIDRYSEHDEE
jgi:hypothetical protein